MSSSLPTANTTTSKLPGGTSLYSLLGLPFPFAGTSLDIRRAYRRAALLHHPDRNCGGNGGTSTSNTSVEGAASSSSSSVQVPFHVLHRAASLLLDPARRAEYDGWFQAGGGGDGLSSGRVRRVDVGDERTFMVVLKMPWGMWGSLSSSSTSQKRDTINSGTDGLLRSILDETSLVCVETAAFSNLENTIDIHKQLFKYTEGNNWEDVAESTSERSLNVLFADGEGSHHHCGASSGGGEKADLSTIDETILQIVNGELTSSSSSSQNMDDEEANQPEWVDPADMFIPTQEEPTTTTTTQDMTDRSTTTTIIDPAVWARPDVALVMCRLECRCSGAYTVELPYLHLLLAEVAQHPQRASYVIQKHVILLLLHKYNNNVKYSTVSASQGSLILNHLVSISRRVVHDQGSSPTTTTLAGLCNSLSTCLQDYITAISSTSESSSTIGGIHTEMLVAGKSSSTMRKEVCSMCSLVMGLHSVPEVSVVKIKEGGGGSCTTTTTNDPTNTSKTPVDAAADDDSLFVGLFPRGM